MKRYGTIVVGLGAMGSAALCHLARRGHRALGIDRFSPPHALGSSHGDTRITRLAIGEGAHLTPLAQRSHALWRELERLTGESLLHQVGGLFVSNPVNASTMHVPGFFENTVAAARQHGIAHEILDAKSIRRRFPVFRVADDEIGYYEREAGYVRPEACIAAHLAVAARGGADIRRDETVEGFEASDAGVAVTTDLGRYEADRLVVTAGAWLPALVGADVARHFRVYRQRLFWLDVAGDAAPFRPGACPVFIWSLKERTHGVYGFPAVDGPKGGVKIGTEDFTATTTAEEAAAPVTAADAAAFHADLVAPYLPGLSARCVKSATCLYTVTRDFGFVIDAHPDSGRVLVVSPCSGHGFKHSPAIGEAVAAWADEGRAPFATDAFSLARLGAPPGATSPPRG